MKPFIEAARHIERSTVPSLLALSLLFSGLGAWEAWRGAAARATAADGDQLAAWAREGAAWLTVGGGVALGVAGLAGLLLVRISARRGLRSRSELVGAFGRVSRVLPVALGVQVVGAVLALAGAVAFEVGGLWFIRNPDDRTVLLAILVVVGAAVMLWGGVGVLRNLRRALRVFRPAPMALSGVLVSEAQAPGLFVLLRELAREHGTTPPDTVVAGGENGFFVTAFPTSLLDGQPDAPPFVTHGRLLHMPLPALATLDLGELRTVLAHELAHFSGEDTEYSRRFAPVFAGLGQGAAAMSLRDRAVWGSTLVDRVFERAMHPHTALAVHAFERFSRVVAHWSRVRELEADRAAVASGSPASLATSLLRLGLVSDQLAAELAAIANQPSEAPHDLAGALVGRMAEAGDPAAHLGDHMPHPTDAHPPTWQRIEAAGVAVNEALLARAARPVAPADLSEMQALFADWAALSGAITSQLLDRARRQQATRRAQLHDVARAADGLGTIVLHASLMRPVLGLALLGSFCMAVSAGCVLASLYGGAQDREAWRLLFGIAAVFALGLGFVLLWSVRLWRGRNRPLLVLDQDGVQSPGFAGTVRWLDISKIGVSALQSPTTSFVLRPGVPLPPRTGLIRRLRINEKDHAVQFMAALPRGLDEAAFRALLLRYARAAHAQRALDAARPPHPAAT